MKVLGISGSFRKGSYNQVLINNLEYYFPEEYVFKSYSISDVPMFNQDLEFELPEGVQKLIKEFEDANIILISTPEYNNMLPGAIKNMFEWLSRKYSKHAINGKLLGILGATTGQFGTVRAQNQLLLLGEILGMNVDPHLRFPLLKAASKFDENMKLSDSSDKERLQRFVNKLIDVSTI